MASTQQRQDTRPTIHLLVFGATGHCGRAVVEQARKWNHDAKRDRKFQVTVFCRDIDRAKALLFDNDSLQQECPDVKFVVGSIFLVDDVAEAVQGMDVVINCVSSYTPPHNQMSALTQNILRAKQNQYCQLQWLVHYGFPRGHRYYNVATKQRIMGTPLEHGISILVKWLDCFKYGPAIRDHEKVLDLLVALSKNQQQQKKREGLGWCVFAAPNMVAPKHRKTAYYGGPESIDVGIETSRVWHSVSPHDAAEMLLSHIVTAVPTFPTETQTTTNTLPPLVCFSYR